MIKITFILLIFISSCTIFRWMVPEKKETLEKTNFIWPIEGRIVSYFGKRNGMFHKGIDIAAPEEKKIKASLDGVVTYSDFRPGYGNLIIIAHSDNFSTVYAHCKERFVQEGKRIKQGEIIATVGKTGKAFGPHLHFEIRHFGEAKDPLIYLKNP
ncbi:TPA: hypothetical protein DCX16_04000 [bacterium]|nr:hypothetical protein [bacterium]